MMKLLKIKGWVAVAIFCIANAVSADPLFTSGQKGIPDIRSDLLVINYDSPATTGVSSGRFGVESFFNPSPGSYVDPAGAHIGFENTFMLDFTVDTLGNVVDGSNAFSISGDLADLGLGMGVTTVLAGDVINFGFATAGFNNFEILLNITSGALASAFGSDVGVIIGGGNFTGFKLDEDFDGLQIGMSSDTFKVAQVPEPSILVLFAIAGLSFFRIGKQQG